MGELKQSEISIKFNPEVHSLGSLCNHGHEYENSGKSLRYIKGSHNCPTCERLGKIKWLKNPKNKERIDKYSRDYRIKWLKNPKNKERIDKYSRDYRQEHPAASLFAVKKFYKKASEELLDYYVKTAIRNGCKLTTTKNISPEIIELKRAQLTMHRAILKIKKLLKEKGKNDGICRDRT